jgi:hypothetical protein
MFAKYYYDDPTLKSLHEAWLKSRERDRDAVRFMHAPDLAVHARLATPDEIRLHRAAGIRDSGAKLLINSPRGIIAFPAPIPPVVATRMDTFNFALGVLRDLKVDSPWGIVCAAASAANMRIAVRLYSRGESSAAAAEAAVALAAFGANLTSRDDDDAEEAAKSDPDFQAAVAASVARGLD